MQKIVLVDDDPDILRVAEKRLRAAGYQVLTANDGEAGLQVIRREKPQLAILDLMMPRMHGYQVCQEIREDPELRAMPVIICSAKAYPVDIQKAKQVGASSYLVKPYGLEDLMAKVEEALKSSEPGIVVTFWGTRGSIPTPGTATQRYGGNTSCVEIRVNNTILMMDCGTGAREMGLALNRELRGNPADVHLFISHTHWDHIQGFPFFVPAYTPGSKVTVYSLRGADKSLEKVFTGQMDASYFPVSLGDMAARLHFVELEEEVKVGEATVSHIYLNHPGLAVGFRVQAGPRSVVYLTDHELYRRLSGDNPHNRKLDREINEFARGCDLYIREAQYTEEEYGSKKGWGHSTWRDALESAEEAGVKTLALYHHDPMHDDEAMDQIMASCHEYMKQCGMKFACVAACDNMQLTVQGQAKEAGQGRG